MERPGAAAHARVVAGARLLSGERRPRVLRTSVGAGVAGGADRVGVGQPPAHLQPRLPADVRAVGLGRVPPRLRADGAARRRLGGRRPLRLLRVPDRSTAAPAGARVIRHAPRAVRAPPVRPRCARPLAVPVRRRVRAAGADQRLLPALLPGAARVVGRLVPAVVGPAAARAPGGRCPRRGRGARAGALAVPRGARRLRLLEAVRRPGRVRRRPDVDPLRARPPAAVAVSPPLEPRRRPAVPRRDGAAARGARARPSLVAPSPMAESGFSRTDPVHPPRPARRGRHLCAGAGLAPRRPHGHRLGRVGLVHRAHGQDAGRDPLPARRVVAARSARHDGVAPRIGAGLLRHGRDRDVDLRARPGPDLPRSAGDRRRAVPLAPAAAGLRRPARLGTVLDAGRALPGRGRSARVRAAGPGGSPRHRPRRRGAARLGGRGSRDGGRARRGLGGRLPPRAAAGALSPARGGRALPGPRAPDGRGGRHRRDVPRHVPPRAGRQRLQRLRTAGL